MTNGKRPKVTVFVSYSHADVKPRPNVNSSRLGELYSEMKHELAPDLQRSGFDFLKDSEGMLALGDRIDTTISAGISKADIAIVFLSRQYCNSDSCEKEFRELIEKDKKLILVELDEAWAKEDDHLLVKYRDRLGNILSIRFWDEADGRFRRFGYPVPSATEAAYRHLYYEQLQRLVRDIRAAARQIREARTEDGTASDQYPHVDVILPADRVHVVLAAPTSDTRDEIDRLEHSFQTAGFSVLRLDRVEAELSAEMVKTCVGQGDVFVQVFGAMPGRTMPDFDNKPGVVAQYEIAKAAGVDIAAWITNDFDIDECGDVYAQFLRDVLCHRSSFEEFEAYAVKLVKQKIEIAQSKIRRRERKGSVSDPDVPLVSIDAADVDAEFRDRIKAALEKYVDVDCIDSNTDMDALADSVRDNDAIVLVYGGKAESQKRAKAHFRIFRRHRATVWHSKKRRFEIAFGDASPPGGLPCPTGRDIHVIRVEDDVDHAMMDEFLASLGVEASGAGR